MNKLMFGMMLILGGTMANAQEDVSGFIKSASGTYNLVTAQGECAATIEVSKSVHFEDAIDLYTPDVSMITLRGINKGEIQGSGAYLGPSTNKSKATLKKDLLTVTEKDCVHILCSKILQVELDLRHPMNTLKIKDPKKNCEYAR